MKQKTSFKQRMNNKGFSLIELLMAIALLAIIIIPVLNSFITSARINRDARKVMIATDVAQTIMEGFSDKGFSDINASLGQLQTVDLSGNYALSSIQNNWYNNKAHFSTVTWSNMGVISSNSVTYLGTTYPARSMVSQNSLDMCRDFCRLAVSKAYSEYSLNNSFGTTGLIGFSDPANMGAFLCYTNVPKDGYYYDVVVSILPTAQNANDTFYAYNIKLFVFETDGLVTNITQRGDTLLMTMEGGIRK